MHEIIDFCNNISGNVDFNYQDEENDLVITMDNATLDEGSKKLYLEIAMPSKEQSAMIEVDNDYIDYAGYRMKSNSIEGKIDMIRPEIMENVYAIIKHGFSHFKSKGILNF